MSLATLEPGDYFGEMALLEQAPRSASARALGAVRLAVLELTDLDQLAQEAEDPTLVPRLMLAHVMAQNQRIRRSNAHAVRELRSRLAEARQRQRQSTLLVLLMVLFSVYAYGISSLQAMRGAGLLLASLGVAAGASAAAVVFIRASGLSWARFGLTWARWPSALGLGLAWSVGMCAALTGIKLAGITWLPAWQGLPLWAPGPTLTDGAGLAALLALAYLASSLIQEFASRVFLQTSLELVLQGPRASLLAVTVLHFITGMWALDLLGLMELPGVSR